MPPRTAPRTLPEVVSTMVCNSAADLAGAVVAGFMIDGTLLRDCRSAVDAGARALASGGWMENSLTCVDFVTDASTSRPFCSLSLPCRGPSLKALTGQPCRLSLHIHGTAQRACKRHSVLRRATGISRAHVENSKHTSGYIAHSLS